MRWQPAAARRHPGSPGRRPASTWVQSARRLKAERAALFLLLVAVGLIALSYVVFGATKVPLTVLLLPIMIGALTLSVWGMVVLMLCTGVVAGLEVSELGFTTS